VDDSQDRARVLAHARRWFPDLVPAGASSLDAVPFVDKELARSWYGRHVDGARFFSSTGTSGYPKRVPWTGDEDVWYVTEKQSLFEGWIGDCRRGFISLATGHNAESAGIVLGNLGLEVHDAGLTSLEEQAAALIELGPDLLYCSPSILARLIEALDAASRSLRSVRRIITNGEVLFPSARRRAAAFFDIGDADIMDTYGSTEIGTIAHSCPECGAYHFLDGIYPESTAEEVSDLGDLGGDPRRVLLSVSSVKRTSFPIVRFVTYDIVDGLRREWCSGEARFTFDRILGRCDDVLNYGELFPAYELADLIAARLPGARWMVFNSDNHVTVVIEGMEPAGFRVDMERRFPLHSRMTRLGLLDPPTIRFVRNFDYVIAKSGGAFGHSAKVARRILHQAPDPSWFPGHVT